MLIDWFTVGAQALNFIVLVWLLKRFLYKPILDAIDTRETRIAAELADADAKKADAEKMRDTFDHKNQAFDQQRAALLQKATEDAGTERQRLLDDARTAADKLATKRFDALQNDAVNLKQAILDLTRHEVFAIARKALADLATTSLEESMVELFTRRIRSMDSKAKDDFGKALNAAGGPVIVDSAFDLPEAQRSAVEKALHETFAADMQIQFDTAPDLVSGIEVTASGQKIGWSIANYLASMEQGVDALVQTKHKPEAAPKPEPKSKPAPKRKAKNASRAKVAKAEAAHT